ncbi:hypothetical protein V6N13_147209 [Hibiscus sabdariffa]|uniref:Uncharacterized protein n=1 Tax=Hibiscus sabdariffa TaxID=183260 RepID=A0ABR2TV15_9ROSI
MFGSIIWTLRLLRNKSLSSPEMIEIEGTIQRSTRLKEEAPRAFATNSIVRSGFRDQVGTNVIWKTSPIDWVKINTDAARNSNMSLATCGRSWA